MSTALGDRLRYLIFDVLAKDSPGTVDDLIKIIQSRENISENAIYEELIQLKEADVLDFVKSSKINYYSIQKYVFSSHSYWFWLTFFISLITVFMVIFVSNNISSLLYIRNLFGFVFVIFLPGYNFIKIIFPLKTIDMLWRFVLSIGSSLVLVPIIGLIINYSPFMISSVPVVLSLFLLTMSLSIIALYREYSRVMLGTGKER